MKDKEDVWRLENWEGLRPEDSYEQNYVSETVESTYGFLVN